MRSGGFFETPLIKLSEGIDSLGLKSDDERQEFLRCESQEHHYNACVDRSLVSLMKSQMIFPRSSLPSKSCLSSSSLLNLEAVDLKSLLQ